MNSLGISLVAGIAAAALVMFAEGIINVLKAGAGWEQEESSKKMALKEGWARFIICVVFALSATISYLYVFNN